MFNREYVWSPGFISIFEPIWNDFEVDTGEMITKKHSECIPKFTDDAIDDLFAFEFKEGEQVNNVKKKIGTITPAYSIFLWEEALDASQEEVTSFFLPCKDIISFLKLSQKIYDGYYYSENGTLVAFDGTLSNVCNGLIIRKDYLDRFLEENDYALLWACIGEKQYFKGGFNTIWGELDGAFFLNENEVIGEMKFCKSN